jgi:hypothetical protein
MTATDLAKMNYSFLASTISGSGEIFYGPATAKNDERLVVIREKNDTPLADPFSSDGIKVIGVRGNYKFQVEWVNIDCATSGYTSYKQELYNSKYERVAMLTSKEASQEFHIASTSPMAVLKKIVCSPGEALDSTPGIPASSP